MHSPGLQHKEISGYKILERIGVGGMGEVYKAFHPGLGRIAAIKLLFQKEHADRFKNEAYIQSSVNHSNIARLYEYTVAGDLPCIIMEYVEGVSLDSYIIREGRISNDETERILLQIVSALKYLHQQNIFHRDIKPQNFKIEKDGTVKMLDFGISKSKYTPKLTRLGFVVGTTEYMAPEQFVSKGEKASDIWSLGVMTYEMLTGHLPFQSDNQLLLRSQISKAKFTDPKILVPQISEKLMEVIDKCLRPNPSSRPSANELENVLKGRSVDKKPARSISIPYNPALVLGVAFFILIIVMIVLFAPRSGSSSMVLPVQDTIVPEVEINTQPHSMQEQLSIRKESLKINVPGVENAVVLMPDGSVRQIPAEFKGTEGESIEFTIQADGYEDKKVKLVFSPRRTTYEYNLQKKN